MAEEEPGLVLVDEAAAIPVAVLSSLLEQSNRLVFASTVHGYEGSGRGFDLRFGPCCNRPCRNGAALRLSEPVRWSTMTRWRHWSMTASCWMPTSNGTIRIRRRSIERVEPPALAHDEALLRSTFGLLDQCALSDPPVRSAPAAGQPGCAALAGARRWRRVVGVLLALAEGGFDEAMAARVLCAVNVAHVATSCRSRWPCMPGLDEALRLSAVTGPAYRRASRSCSVAALVSGLSRPAADGHRQAVRSCWVVPMASIRPCWRSGRRLGFVSGACRGPGRSGQCRTLIVHAAGPESGRQCTCGRGLQALSGPVALVACCQSEAISTADWRSYCCAIATAPIWRSSAADRRDLERIATGARQPATAEAAVWKALVVIACRGWYRRSINWPR